MTKGKDNKPHIGIFGRRNNGKSSIINMMVGQQVAIVSDVAGTTTDPVKKSIEIPGIGPAIIIDTAGIDDTGDLGELRIQKSMQMLKQIDLAVLVLINNQLGTFEKALITSFKQQDIPFIIIQNKIDLFPLDLSFKQAIEKEYQTELIPTTTIRQTQDNQLIECIRKHIPETAYKKKSLLGDLVSYGDIVLLITPIDIEAPEGRLILPQVQAIRDILDNDCIAIVLKEREVDAFLKQTNIKPKLAITDSQLFLKAAASIPSDIPLTGFSVLLARHKGDFDAYLKGTPAIDTLKDGDRILLLESCTHHSSCDDIGRVKIPRWLSNYTGKQLHFDVVSGLNELQKEITDYALLIQCGGCMITQKQLMNRLKPALDAGIPITNYGMTIAYVQGIYHRAIAPFLKTSTITQVDYL